MAQVQWTQREHPRVRAPRNAPRKAETARAPRPRTFVRAFRGARRLSSGTQRTVRRAPGDLPAAGRRRDRRGLRQRDASSQQLSKVRQRVKEVRFGRPDGASKNPGNLLVRKVMINPQDERRTLFSWQTLNRRADFFGALGAQQGSIRTLGVKVGAIARIERLGPRRLERYAVETDVDGDPVEPGSQRRLTLESFQAFECPDEHILREIRRVFVISNVAIAELIHLTAMPRDDHVECAAVVRDT